MMSTSEKRKARRRISDVHISEPQRFKKWFNWLFGSKTVNLKPTFYKRYPFLAIIGAALLAVSLLIVRNVFTRAEVADFYPVTCLGEWERAQNAQGQPETFGQGSPTFDASNSAMYASGTAKIFCGGFVAQDYEVKGEIKDIGLTLIWQIGPPAGEAGEAGAGTSSSAEEPGAPNNEAIQPRGAASSTPAQDATSSAPAPETSESSTTSFFNFVGIAFAQETAPAANAAAEQVSTQPTDAEQIPLQPADEKTGSVPTEENPQPAASENNESSGTIIISPPITVSLEPVSTSTAETSTAGEPTSTPPTAVPPPAPDENFLEVSYSTDGTNWVSIGKASPVNWKNFTVALPITSWDDLKKLQIKIEGIKTSLLQPLPEVLLDGMLLEVKYEVPPLFSSSEEDLGDEAGRNNASNSEGQTFSGLNAPNPFPGLPQVILPSKKGDSGLPQKSWRAEDQPTLEIDINNLPQENSTSGVPENVPGSVMENSTSTESQINTENQTSTEIINASATDSN